MSTAGRPGWQVRRAGDADGAADVAAALVTRLLRLALDARPRASFAISGGSSPQRMFELLRLAPVEWARVDVFQVDERVAPAGHEDRNLTMQRAALLDHVPAVVHPLEVEHPGGPDLGAVASGAHLAQVLGERPELDVVHLGVGDDGHTASLFPDAPELLEGERLVVATAEQHEGRRRMTLTLPVLEATRDVVVLAPGAAKRGPLRRALASDPALPISLLTAPRVTLVTDQALGDD